MNPRRTTECVLGALLFLGPFIYALTLSAPTPASMCVASEPEIHVIEREVIVPVECVAPEPAPVEPPQQAEPEPEPDPFLEFAAPMLLVDGDYLIFDSDVRPKWGRGELFELPTNHEYTAAKHANPEQVPASVWNLGGRTYDIYGSDDKLCRASVGELFVVAQYGGNEIVDPFRDEFDEDTIDVQAPSPKQIRARVWDTQPKWLVGRLQFEGECEGLWARDAGLPAPIVLQRSGQPTSAAQARLENFHDSGAVAKLEAEYREWHVTSPEFPSWEEQIEYAEPPKVQSWVDAAGTDRVLTIDFGYPGSCGSYDTELDSIEELIDGELVGLDQANDPIAVFDADLDGRLEYLYRDFDVDASRRWVSSTTAALRLEAEVFHDFWCPC